MTKLTCLMPCLNERKTLKECIDKAKESLKKLNVDGEVLIADNGSTDGSIEIALQNGAKVINVEEKGYGSALITGIKNAKGEFVIMGDSDGTYPWDEIDAIYLELTKGFDLVMGNRFGGKIINGSMPFLSRFIGNPILSFLGRLFFKVKINDFHCGLRGFNNKKMLELNLNSKGMEFASEIVIKSALNNLKITEVNTKLFPGPVGRKPHLRPFRDGWRHLRLLLTFAPVWSGIFPGFIFISSGLIIFSIIFLNNGVFFNLELREHSLITSIGLILLGFNSLISGCIGIFSLSNYSKYRNHNLVKILKKSRNLDRLIVVGFLTIVSGLFFIIKSFNYWKNLDFANIEPASQIFQLSPGILLILLGTQLIFSSFLFETIKNNLITK